MLQRKGCAAIRGLCFFVVCPAALFGCDSGQGEVEKSAQAFADCYYNLRYKEALGLVTESSKRRILFAASNVSEEDIDVFNGRDADASCHIDDVEVEGDTAARVDMTVRNVLAMDSIGVPATIKDQIKVTIKLERKGKKWLVDLK